MVTKRVVEVDAAARDLALGAKSQHRAVLEAVEQILDDGRKASTVWDKDAGKIVLLGMDGIKVLLWSDLKPEQQREMERIIPLRPTNAVQYGDALIVVGTRAQWKQRQDKKAMLARRAGHQAQSEHSVQTMSREFGPGVRVDDAYVPLPPGAEVGR